MYNMLFGVNPAAYALMSHLHLKYHSESCDVEGEYPIGRFRDIYLSKEGDKLILFTRNGGGNRHCWELDGCPRWVPGLGKYAGGEDGRTIDVKDKGRPENHDRECLVYVNWKLTTHPLYITDYDDGYDPTYAYFEFKVPDSMQSVLDKLMAVQGGPQKNVSEKFDALMEEMKSMTPVQVRTDPRFSQLNEIFKKIQEHIKS